MTELGCGNVRYSEAVRQLEGLLELERETLSVKRKVSGFTVDYDDDLVKTDPPTNSNFAEWLHI